MPHKLFHISALSLTLSFVSCNKPSQQTNELLKILENAEAFVHQSMTAYCELGPVAIAPSIPEEFNYLLAEIDQASEDVGGFTRVDLVSARLNPIEFQDETQISTEQTHRLRVTTVMEGTNDNGAAIYLILAGTPNSWDIIDIETDAQPTNAGQHE